MLLFRRRVTLISTKKKEIIDAAEQKLNAAGIENNRWTTEPLPPGGCGAKIDPAECSGSTVKNRDEFRKVYHIEVAKADEEKARRVLNLPAKEE